LKLNLTFNQKGRFDLDSNYSGCDSGVLSKIGEVSKVNYIDPRDGLVNQSLSMPALCLNVVDAGAGLIISKNTYKEDKSVTPSRFNEQGSFSAGEEVTVRIVINEVLSSRATWKIEDQIPPSVTKLNGTPTLLVSSGKVVNLQYSLNGGAVSFQNDGSNSDAKLLAGTNVIEYKYNF
jgi:hypothetical protein